VQRLSVVLDPNVFIRDGHKCSFAVAARKQGDAFSRAQAPSWAQITCFIGRAPGWQPTTCASIRSVCKFPPACYSRISWPRSRSAGTLNAGTPAFHRLGDNLDRLRRLLATSPPNLFKNDQSAAQRSHQPRHGERVPDRNLFHAYLGGVGHSLPQTHIVQANVSLAADLRVAAGETLKLLLRRKFT
jgi:hypothetical protein